MKFNWLRNVDLAGYSSDRTIKLTAQEEVALELRASQDLWNLISCSGMPVAVNAQKEHFPDK
ncbi:hypothetical protein QQ045_031741 [Rhodiola kirilowii]